MKVEVRDGAVFDGHGPGEVLVVTVQQFYAHRAELLAVGTPEWSAKHGVSTAAPINTRGE